MAPCFISKPRSGRRSAHWMPYSAVVPARNAGRILPGPYKVASAGIEAAGVETRGAAVGIYRGAGRPEAALAMELLIDRLAEALDLPAGEVRRRNFVAAADMPSTTPTGQRFWTAATIAPPTTAPPP